MMVKISVDSESKDFEPLVSDSGCVGGEYVSRAVRRILRAFFGCSIYTFSSTPVCHTVKSVLVLHDEFTSDGAIFYQCATGDSWASAVTRLMWEEEGKIDHAVSWFMVLGVA